MAWARSRRRRETTVPSCPLAPRRRPSANTDRPGRPGAVSDGSPPRCLLAILLLCLTAQADAGYCIPGVPQPPIPRDLPLAARIQPAPPAVTALARQRNLGNGVAIEPRPASLDHPVAQALARTLAELPEGLRRLAQNQLGAIYLVQGNFGSARVEAMRDAQGRVFAAASCSTSTPWPAAPTPGPVGGRSRPSARRTATGSR